MQSSGGKRLFSMVVTLVSLIGAAVVFFQFIRPAYLETQDVRAEVIARVSFLDQQTASIDAAQKLIEKYRSDTAAQETVSRALPATPDIAGALYQLTAIASQYNIAILSTTAQTPQLAISNVGGASSTIGAVQPLGIATFQVKFNARYEDVKAMIQKLEGNVRLMDVTALSMTQNTTPGGTVNGDLTVATYYQITKK